jgi:hypothetical protein
MLEAIVEHDHVGVERGSLSRRGHPIPIRDMGHTG